MWRSIFRPELLFLVAVLQALLPYVLWAFGLGEANAQLDIRLNYLPVFIWCVGYFSFLAGSMLASGPTTSEPVYSLQTMQIRLNYLTAGVILSVLAQLIALTRVYGTLPILSYLRQDHQLDITKAVKLQADSGVGQIGMLHLTLFILNALVLIQFIINLETRKKAWVLILFAMGAMLVGNLSNGKRQGLFRALVFFCCGLSVYSNKLVDSIGRALPIPRNRFVAACAIVLMVGCFIGLTGYIAFARNQGKFQRRTLTEIIAYQEFPLINFEHQCEQVGFGPFRFDLLYSCQRLIPFKWIESTGIAQMEHPLHPIPSSPAGLYEDIQWSTGLWGVAGFSLFLGFALRLLYRHALTSLLSLLIYSQCAFALLVSHSFNEFLILTYDPAPFVCFGFVVWLLGGTRNHTPTVRPVEAAETAVAGLSWC